MAGDFFAALLLVTLGSALPSLRSAVSGDERSCSMYLRATKVIKVMAPTTATITAYRTHFALLRKMRLSIFVGELVKGLPPAATVPSPSPPRPRGHAWPDSSSGACRSH